MEPLYEIEVWTKEGRRVADISRFCKTRTWSAERNDAETLKFVLDLDVFEKYCQDKLGGVDPTTLIAPYSTDIKIKRAGQYLYGFEVVDVAFAARPKATQPTQVGGASIDDSGSYDVTITCEGYVNLFKARYTSNVYTQTERTAIAADLIRTEQAKPNGDVGVTVTSPLYATGSLSDRTYAQDNVKTKLQELAALTDNPFDFSFSWDKVFRTYDQIGARRFDIDLIWGGPLSNVIGFNLDRTAANLFNYIYGIGSGSGDVALTSYAGDAQSQQNYYLRERIDQFGTVSIQSTLDQNVVADLTLYKDVLEMPEIVITTNDIPVDAHGVSQFISVGDRIPLKVASHPWLASIDGLFRVEKIAVAIDDNDFETITLTFDSWQVNQNE